MIGGMAACKNCDAEIAWWEKNCPVCGTYTGGLSFFKNRAMLSNLRVLLCGFTGACLGGAIWLSAHMLFGFDQGRPVAWCAGLVSGVAIGLFQRRRAIRAQKRA